jgi:hypothetical protein
LAAKIYNFGKDMKKLDEKARKAGKKLLKPGLEDAIKKRSGDGTLSCALCFIVANDMNVKPEEVGHALDLMNMPITKCQLGLFGNSPISKIVQKAEAIPEEMERAIREMLENDRLKCQSSWQIAEKFAIPKIKVSSFCEALGIKISSCQLGAF